MAAQQQQIDLTTLSTPQLSQLQSRLSQELDHLTSSYQRLRQAQGRFRDCIRSVNDGVGGRSEGLFHFLYILLWEINIHKY